MEETTSQGEQTPDPKDVLFTSMCSMIGLKIVEILDQLTEIGKLRSQSQGESKISE